MIAGVPLSLLTAIYTAYLFAQAKARDMWQNPLLPPHLVFQAALLGSAVLLPVATVMNNRRATCCCGYSAITERDSLADGLG